MRNIKQINKQTQYSSIDTYTPEGLDEIYYTTYVINDEAETDTIVKIGYCSDNCSNQYPIFINEHAYYCGKHGMYEQQNENIDSDDTEKKVEIQTLKGRTIIEIPYAHLVENLEDIKPFNFTFDFVIER